MNWIDYTKQKPTDKDARYLVYYEMPHSKGTLASPQIAQWDGKMFYMFDWEDGQTIRFKSAKYWMKIEEPSADFVNADKTADHFREVTQKVDELRKERDAYYERLQELRQEKAEIDEAKFESEAESYERGFADGQEVGEREMNEKACEWLCKTCEIGICPEERKCHRYKGFRKAMGISGNKEEIPSKYDADYLQSKIDAFTEARKKDGKTADDILEECRGGSLDLTWQDMQNICRIETKVSSSFEFGDPDKVSDEEFYTEVLRRFKEESK